MVEKKRKRGEKPVQVFSFNGCWRSDHERITFHHKLGQEPPCKTVAKRKDTVKKRTADVQAETEQIILKSKDNADCLPKESSSVHAKSLTNTEKIV